MSLLTYVILSVLWLLGSLLSFIIIVGVISEFSEKYLPYPLESLGGIGKGVMYTVGFIGMALAIGYARC